MWQYLKVVLPILVPLLAAGIAWVFNERAKRKAEEYIRREEKYRALVDALRGFYEHMQDTRPLREEFLRQLSLSWLYCSDDVIRKANAFLSTVGDVKVADEAKFRAVGELMLEIRRDLISRRVVRRTTLQPQDYLHRRAT
jgi:hypothetical protein